MKQTAHNQTSSDKTQKMLQAVRVAVLSLCFFATVLFLLFAERSTVSMVEKRELAKLPVLTAEALLNGDYTAGISQYYNDTIPLRDSFKGLVSDILSFSGIRYDDVIFKGTIPVPDEREDDETQTQPNTQPPTAAQVGQPESSTQVQTTQPETDPEPEPQDDGILTDGMLILKDRGINLFGGSLKNGKTYAEYVNAYHKDLPDVRVYSLVAPTSQTFFLPQKYANRCGSEPENFDNIRKYLDGVTEVDALAAMLAHKQEDLFFRTDHHWTALGAYYAAQAFAQVADVPFADLSSYERVEKEGFVGSFYSFTDEAVFKNNPEPFVYYKPQNEYETTYYTTAFEYDYKGPLLIQAYGSALYCTFMGSDAVIAHVETDCKNGRTLLVMKDSYGNALIPFFTGSFEHIYVTDMRYFECNAIDFIREHGVTDLLFAMCSFSATGSNFRHIEKNRTR